MHQHSEDNQIKPHWENKRPQSSETMLRKQTATIKSNYIEKANGHNKATQLTTQSNNYLSCPWRLQQGALGQLRRSADSWLLESHVDPATGSWNDAADELQSLPDQMSRKWKILIRITSKEIRFDASVSKLIQSIARKFFVPAWATPNYIIFSSWYGCMQRTFARVRIQ
jgi:hypothetical protein